ncbi:MAG: uracil phosphoribosyltransferase [Ruminococcus sp.]|nr:uracil phosphoribosyltransferase [Ruminococcus sp.]MBR1750246.1 uracil phosphoribosyltransferase [Ruminococcus sp.]
MSRPMILDHPLIKHKISLLRDKNTGTKDFRTLVEEISMLMTYEALRNLPTENVRIETPICETMQPMLCGKKAAVVPILRAGLGMTTGILTLLPSAKVGHIGLYRDEDTHQPHEYLTKLPSDLDKRFVIVTDPMLATGGSAVAAIDLLKAKGSTNIKFMCIIAAPEGLKALTDAHPDIEIYVGALDERLNENAYIVPGLGDAGDRIFGTLV